ncbi:hypothetical protein TNIN_228711 [Trichonephila inaurata madagascariensis]|uniref:Uncharacterized protein n=1 Tax=Trichonephila inaurata madagascariensis TaxID=2747483 RepID=A0A8X6X4Q5_9ARAC|nr:hypothetical protein TNIN_228711 [Trichonephila inaurata madagascariensis]
MYPIHTAWSHGLSYLSELTKEETDPLLNLIIQSRSLVARIQSRLKKTRDELKKLANLFPSDHFGSLLLQIALLALYGISLG